VRVETSLNQTVASHRCWASRRTRIGVSNTRLFRDPPNAHTTPPTSPFMADGRIAEESKMLEPHSLRGYCLPLPRRGSTAHPRARCLGRSDDQCRIHRFLPEVRRCRSDLPARTAAARTSNCHSPAETPFPPARLEVNPTTHPRPNEIYVIQVYQR
jgi:hypothetical protein